MLDVFRNDAFSAVSLTAAILKAPYKPSRIGQLGLFREKGITTTTVVIEEKDGALELIPSSPRGGPAENLGPQRRTARAFVVPHYEKDSTIYADSVQNVRAFGSDDQLQGVQALVDERLAILRAQHEVTLEWQRMGAIRGQILDADGSVMFDLFDEFGVAQQTMVIDIGADDVRNQAVAAQRLIEDELGAEPVTGYRGFCGDHFFDELIAAEAVRESVKFQESNTLRTDLRKGFEYGGVVWENYRGRVSGQDFVGNGDCYLVPEGTSIFQTAFAPADFLEAVNTVGLPIYVKQAPDPSGLNRFVRLHSQSNPLALNTRPRAVVKLTISS